MTVTLLDGGMGQELIARSPDAPTPLWATQVMIDHPHLVRAVHDAFFAAGAEIATTNTYATHRDRLEPRGLGPRFGELQRLGCRLAVEARDAHGSGRVAGSAGPLGWSYNPASAPPAAEAAPLYAEVAAAQAPYVDLHLAETLSSVDQVRGALMGLLPAGRPVWVAVTVDDRDGTRLRSGEPVAALLPLLAEMTPDALLVNCSVPEAVTQALGALADCPLPLGAYANGFVEIVPEYIDRNATVAALTARTDLGPAVYADHAETWVRLGATLIGGCCEVGPAHVAELKRRLKPDA